MSDFRDQFPITKDWVFFNHAAVAPLCRRCCERIEAWMVDMRDNGGMLSEDWFGAMEEIRGTAARLLNAKSTEVAFLKNTTEGIATIAEGFPWQVGDNVVLPEGEYPSNVYPWLNLASRGVEVRTVPARGMRIVVDDIAAAINERTRLVSVSFVQFATGYRSDLATIGALCRDRGVDFFVDAIQGLGVLPLDVETMQIDYLSADGHKWLCGPEGASLFYIRESKLDKIRTLCAGWKSVVHWSDFSTIDFRLQPRAARHEGGSFNTPGIVGLGGCLDYFEEVGGEMIQANLRRVTDELIGKLEAQGAEVVSPRGDSEWSGIVAFNWPGKEPTSTVRRCRKEHVILSARGGRFRASPHFYNNSDDIDRMIETLQRV
jgi:selenocysteine lyase/cysteine desulfurase